MILRNCLIYLSLHIHAINFATTCTSIALKRPRATPNWWREITIEEVPIGPYHSQRAAIDSIRMCKLISIRRNFLLR